MSSVNHPLFARIYTRFSQAAEKAGTATHRDELLSGVAGRVIEVGAGNGLNFTHYPSSVVEVVAVEPEPYLRDRASEEAERAAVPITVVPGTAEDLPADDESFDVAVTSLVLCPVRNPSRALQEIRRVLRPADSFASSNTFDRTIAGSLAPRPSPTRRSGHALLAGVTQPATLARRSSMRGSRSTTSDASISDHARSRSSLPHTSSDAHADDPFRDGW